MRENVFRSVEGLRINDDVIDEGRGVLAKMSYDSVVDRADRPPFSKGASVKLDQYQLGLIVGQAAHNLQRVRRLLDDPQRFAEHPQSDADRDLGSVRGALQAVADAQERSLNLLSGEYETEALDDLISRGSKTKLGLGDPIVTSPGFSPPPVGGAQQHGSLFASTPVGHVTTAVAISQRLTDAVEKQVLIALMPGIDRCRAIP